ncbi:MULTISPECIES: hypothetical protein [Enterobacter cloacae complex]|uniref:hypothetical protein n=1 Tax=Enterobacter cloacae complex TaxID=354276 RepID=UPI0032AED43D|nr:hypothetical protein [Klebsiella variicola subsp. variicola]
MTIDINKLSPNILSNSRTLAPTVSHEARDALDELIDPNTGVNEYRSAMLALGEELGALVAKKMPNRSKQCLIVSTAEDADFLANGVCHALSETNILYKNAVLWNNHYALKKGSVAPVIHSYMEPGYESSNFLIVVKSVISGSCVVRTNILSLIDKIDPEKIFIVSPVMHEKSEMNLRKEFPDEIAGKFDFTFFAIDRIKSEDGEVIPGIGGQVYQKLGLSDQPVKIGYLPDTVRRKIVSLSA